VKILVLNAGSSSLKFKLFDMSNHMLIASGLIEEIAETEGEFHLHFQGRDDRHRRRIVDHADAFALLYTTFEEKGLIDSESNLSAIGHRFVHGGEQYYGPTRIDLDLIEKLQELNTLAPLHNPANLLGIRVAMEHAPNIPQIAVFDTAFHHTMPPHAYLYALPRELYEEYRIRRYGFHGTSHHYVAQQAAKTIGKPLEALNLITLHLGNGASACAIKKGKSIDTSMGFTPLEGLVMGTRSGDIDPAIIPYLMEKLGLNVEEISTLLNTESGLKGLCGENDLRSILEQADEGSSDAQLALEIFCYRIKKYIGAYTAVLGRVDAIIFTGGIGEHASLVRTKALAGLDETFGIVLDSDANGAVQDDSTRSIHRKESRTALFIIPTDEELFIAQQTRKLIENR